jgi:hypothetical protein
MWKGVIRGLLILAGVLAIAFFVLRWSFSEKIPQGIKGAKATELAVKMLDALNADSLKNTDSISWNFRDTNFYNWRLQTDSVTVNWDNYRVELSTLNPSMGNAFENENLIEDVEDRQEALDYALSNFNNDSFWLIAPYKVMDPGAQLEWISENELLVRYTSGGSTPGDVYVWQLEDNHLPVSFKMWVGIIPLDAIDANWNNWKTTPQGFKLPESRSLYGFDIPIKDVVVY